MKTKIYKLIDPITNEIRYIGKTEKDLIERLISHINYTRLHRLFDDKNDWIKSLIIQGFCPKIELIEEVENDVKQKEIYWIEFYGKFCNLLNIQHNKHQDLSNLLSKLRSTPIYEYTLEGDFVQEWKNSVEAANFYGIDAKAICAVVSKKKKSYKGKQWSREKKENIGRYFIKKKGKTKVVHQYTMAGDFVKSYENAGKVGFVDRKQVNSCCSGTTKSAKGFRWSYEKVDKLPPYKVEGRNFKRKISEEDSIRVVEMYNNGIPTKDLCMQFCVSDETIYSIIKRTNMEKHRIKKEAELMEELWLYNISN